MIERLGFPAHAGMDLCSLAKPISTSGFPRPRGDGPLHALDILAKHVVSPPTRGWTVL